MLPIIEFYLYWMLQVKQWSEISHSFLSLNTFWKGWSHYLARGTVNYAKRFDCSQLFVSVLTESAAMAQHSVCFVSICYSVNNCLYCVALVSHSVNNCLYHVALVSSHLSYFALPSIIRKQGPWTLRINVWYLSSQCCASCFLYRFSVSGWQI